MFYFENQLGLYFHCLNFIMDSFRIGTNEFFLTDSMPSSFKVVQLYFHKRYGEAEDSTFQSNVFEFGKSVQMFSESRLIFLVCDFI